MTPIVLNIVCFRYDPGGLDEAGLRALNSEIMLRLQEAGIAALSDTPVKERHCLSVAICNHRTRREDLDLVVREGLRMGDDLILGCYEPAAAFDDDNGRECSHDLLSVRGLLRLPTTVICLPG